MHHYGASRIPVGPAAAAETVSQLIDRVRFHTVERLDALVEGSRAAVRWRATLSAGGGEPAETELYDLWTFDDQYRAISLVQFADAALIANLFR